MKNILNNWKTSVAGILVLFCVGLYLSGKITSEQLTTSIPIVTGLALFAAKDSNK